ncbi:MAG: hypothetical protein OEQ39_01515 [Gammaproteobacteria bacterium]|nr:hypothetical protein [Gammaproteobacteria bacterium]MDH3467850.1 hypothetical protein [Gammaproteobacteria bacterium]
MNKTRRAVLVKLFLWLVVYPGIPFVVGSIGIIGYANWPRNFETFDLPTIAAATEQVVFIVHGKDDDTNTWALEMQAIYRDQSDNATQVFALDWTPYSDNFLRCSVDGHQIGVGLGERLATHTNVKNVHLIGHSAGAFVVYGLCEGTKRVSESIQIQTTYLDPLGIYGGMRRDYGLNNFGSCADFSEAYIDVESGVPGSNEPLLKAHTFDVTGLRSTRSFGESPHIWPVNYYMSELRNGSANRLVSDPALRERFPPGLRTVVD